MKVVHRYNSDERQHFLLEKHYTFKLKPRLLYVGFLEKHGGWCEEAHAHDFLEIIFVTDGKGTIAIEDKFYDVRKGDIIVYNADMIHFEKSSVEDPMRILFVAYDKLEITDLPPNRLIPPAYESVYPSGNMYGVFLKYFNMLIDEFESKERFYMEISQNISRTLLMYVFRLINRTENAAVLLDLGRRMEAALSYIDKNYKQQITLDELAEKCFTNKYYLSHLFTRVQGVSIGKYILEKKIMESKRLLDENKLSVADVAASVGFHDPSYYCRVFKKETGLTPSDYRKRLNKS